MAEIVTGTVTGQIDQTALLQDHADIRREAAFNTADIRRDQEVIGSNIRRETAKEASDLKDSVKTSGWANSDRTGTEADRVVAQDTAYFIAGQSQNFANATALAALKAGTDMQFANTLAAINSSAQQGQAATALEGAKNAAATALEGAKAAAATALGQALLGQAIVTDGNATRALLNTLKMEELNRVLAERQAEIIEHRGDSRHYRDGLSNVQTNALSSQINALHSQFQAATQKTVNFGTMGANTNASTNNVA
jgi:hypothetical protein